MNSVFKTIETKITNNFLIISLNRPEVRNAINETMIQELTQVFTKDINQNNELRGVVIKGNGPVFCAGADLNWMKKAITLTESENIEDATNLSNLFQAIHNCKFPVIGSIHGAAIGGAMGITAVCDIVIAEKDTVFSLSEVKLGIVPAIVGPYILEKIGTSWAKALFLSAQRFDAKKAEKIGLIHEIAESTEDLRNQTEKTCDAINQAYPIAIQTAKAYLKKLPSLKKNDQLLLSVETLAKSRVSKEAKEGISKFLKK